MSAVVQAILLCDLPGCRTEYIGPASMFGAPRAKARAEARAAGWRVGVKVGRRSGSYDYCGAAHREAATRAES